MPSPSSQSALLRRLKPGLIVHNGAEINAEPPVPSLAEPITPIDAFFVRNNGDLPEIGDPEAWTLTVDGEVERPLVLDLSALRERFETVTITAVLECAGNGRAFFVPGTDGLPWRHGAVGCARWSGVRLADVLAAAGVKPSAVYTGHHSPDPWARSQPARAGKRVGGGGEGRGHGDRYSAGFTSV